MNLLMKAVNDELGELKDECRRLTAENERLNKQRGEALAILNDKQLITRIGATDGLMIVTGRIGQYEGPTLDDARAVLREKREK